MGFIPSIPLYDEKARAVELKSMTESYEIIPKLTNGDPVIGADGKQETMNGRKLEDIDPLLELRDRYKLKTTARTVGGLIKAIISYIWADMFQGLWLFTSFAFF